MVIVLFAVFELKCLWREFFSPWLCTAGVAAPRLLEFSLGSDKDWSSGILEVFLPPLIILSCNPRPNLMSLFFLISGSETICVFQDMLAEFVITDQFAYFANYSLNICVVPNRLNQHNSLKL